MRLNGYSIVVVLAVALGVAHAPTLPQAWRGEITYSRGIDVCVGPFAMRAAPGDRATPSAESCDTVYSQRMAWDAWRRIRDAWQSRSSAVAFVARDMWSVATSGRALNLLDLLVFVWPAHFLFEPAASLVVLHLSLLGVGALSGVVLAWGLGRSPLAMLAAGVVTGGSGLVIETTVRGQYPQAVILGFCLYFAGMARLDEGKAGGTALVGGGLALSALLYWMNGLILGLGALAFVLARPRERTIVPLLRGMTVASIGAFVACLPAVVPVIEALFRGAEEKMRVIPWGTPFPDAAARDGLIDLIDEVPWFTFASPTSGWLPVLPLLPFAVLGLYGRRQRPWLVLTILGIALALGPWPCFPGGSSTFPAFGALPRVHNPLYTWVYQWVPLASRMHHPLRWAALSTVALAAATAGGIDRTRVRWPDHAGLGVAAGLLWTMAVGPWPLATSVFPAEIVAKLRGCAGLVLPSLPPGDRELDDVHRLEGLLWLPRAPAGSKGSGGVGAPTLAMLAWADPRVRALDSALSGAARPDDDPLAGMCIVYEARWIDRNSAHVREALIAAFGPAQIAFTARGLFAVDGTDRQIEVYTAHGGPGHAGPRAGSW